MEKIDRTKLLLQKQSLMISAMDRIIGYEAKGKHKEAKKVEVDFFIELKKLNNLLK